MSVENHIEKGRQVLREKQELERSTRELFQTAVDLLKSKGRLKRSFRILKFQKLDHTVNSAQPPINVTIQAGANLEKAKRVDITIEGFGRLQVHREVIGSKEIFRAFVWSSDINERRSSGIQGFINALR